jgi:tetratricopeptide (TPR) repeat protein
MEEMAVRSAQALAAAERAGRPALRAEAMLLVVQILQHEGNLEECRTILDEISALAAACGHRRALAVALAYRGIVHYWQSEYLEAEERLAQALPIATDQHDSLVTLVCLQFLGLARGNRGLMSQALAALAEGIELGRKNGDRFWLPRLASHVGWVHRELEDFDEAITHDREAVTLAREFNVAAAEVDALLNLGLDYSAAGRFPEAEGILMGLESRARGSDWFGWLHEIRLQGALAEHWMARGNRERSARYASRLLALAKPRGGQVYVATAHRILFDAALAAGDRARALEHAAAAASVLARQPVPNFGWRLQAALGGLYAALGDMSKSRVAYGQSAALVRQIAAGVTDARLRGTFLASPAVQAALDREPAE